MAAIRIIRCRSANLRCPIPYERMILFQFLLSFNDSKYQFTTALIILKINSDISVFSSIVRYCLSLWVFISESYSC